MPEYLFTEKPRPIIFQRGDLQVPAHRVVSASCWIEAKAKLGYPLTALQKAILAGTADQFTLYGHHQTRGAGGRLYEAPKLPDATEIFLNTIGETV